MKTVAKVLNKHQLAWAKALPGSNMWSLYGPDLDLSLHDNYGMFCEINPAGALVIVHIENSHICSMPVAIEGEHNEERMRNHFVWVQPGMSHIQCMLWRVLNYIQITELWDFYFSILTNDCLMAEFYRAKGSNDHHHAYAGGLIEHSYEVASAAAMQAKQFGLGHATIWLSYVAGLLHDIGKISMFYNQEDGGVCVQHEAMSFMMLSHPLEKLRRASPNLFEALSSALVAKVGRHQPQYLPETLVRMCDRISVEINLCRKAFSSMPSYYWYAKEGVESRVFKRLDYTD